MNSPWARRFATGLSSLWDRATARLAALRFNPSREPRTIDVSSKAWGRNAETLTIIDGGSRLKLAVWSTPCPLDGDYLILKNGGGTTRYRADSVEYCGNPQDMCFVEASFAPREDSAE